MKLSLTNYLRIYMSADDLKCHNISTNLKYKVAVDGDWLVLTPKTKGNRWHASENDMPRICFKRSTIDELSAGIVVKNSRKVEFYGGVSGAVHIKLPLQDKKTTTERLAEQTGFEKMTGRYIGLKAGEAGGMTHNEWLGTQGLDNTNLHGCEPANEYEDDKEFKNNSDKPSPLQIFFGVCIMLAGTIALYKYVDWQVVTSVFN